MEKERIFTMSNRRPGMFTDDKIQGGIDMDTNKTTYSEVLDNNEHTITFRELASHPNRENIVLDSPIFTETQTTEIPIRHFNHMPVINELLALEYCGKVYLADVTDIDYKEGIIHIKQRLSHMTRSQNQRTLELYKRLLRKGAYTAHQLAVLRDTTAEEAQEYLDQQEAEHTVFTVDNNGVTLYPEFLFNDEGNVDETISKLVQIFQGKFGGWSAWAWFCLPTGMLSGNIPVEMAYRDFHRAQTATTHMYNELFNPYY